MILPSETRKELPSSSPKVFKTFFQKCLKKKRSSTSVQEPFTKVYANFRILKDVLIGGAADAADVANNNRDTAVLAIGFMALGEMR